MKYRSDLRAHLFEIDDQSADDIGQSRRECEAMDWRRGVMNRLRLSAVPNRHDVAVFYEIFFAFQPQQAFLL